MMLNKLSNIHLPSIGLVLVLLPIHSTLAASSAIASLDWSQFQIHTLLGNVNFIGIENSFYTYGEANLYTPTGSTYDRFDSYDWSSILTATAEVTPETAAFGAADAGSLSSQAKSIYNDYLATSISTRQADYLFTGSGIIEITLPYSLFAESASSNDSYVGSFNASSWVSLNIESRNNGFDQYSSSSANLYDFIVEDNTSSSKAGFLSLIFHVDGDKTLTLYGRTAANAEGVRIVPLPNSIWLMISTLMGFLSFARYKKVR